MRMLNEIELQEFCRMLAFEQSRPVGAGEVFRNAQYRIYNISGRYFALLVAIPSEWVTDAVEIREEEIPAYVK